MKRRVALFLNLLFCLAPSGLIPTAAAAQELISYDHAWRYQFAGRDLSNPLLYAFMDPLFDDSTWNIGMGSFGDGAVQDGLCSLQPCCPLQASARTGWCCVNRLLLRTHFQIAPGTPIVGYFTVDNEAWIWVNGSLVAYVSLGDGCPVHDEFTFSVPTTILTADSSNVIAVHANNNGGEAYFELRLTVDIPTAVHHDSWGGLKLLYR